MPNDALSGLSEVVLTTITTPDNVHFMRSLDATWCGASLDRESRSTARDVTAGALEAEGAEVCFACQMRWFEGQEERDIGRYVAENPGTVAADELINGATDKPGQFLAGYLDGLGK